MHAYTAPVDDMRFVLSHIAGLEELSKIDCFSEVSEDLVAAILEEGAKVTGEVIAPLNWTGDQQGCSLENGVVRTPEGFKEAYSALVDGGWGSLPFDPEYGGQGLPWVVQTAFSEMLNSANLALALAPLLTQGAIDAIEHHGSDEQRATYLPKLISGAWNGTMNLTEPQAGTDVGALKTRAIPQDDGTYRIKGQKIYITWGENDCSENVVHLVLARTPDAPEGTKGISLFIVPKFLLTEEGTPENPQLGARNDLRCSGLEEKLGIHGSPTCVMSYGDNEGAVGYLIGKEYGGMAAMFTMMNSARLAVGVQGLAIAERAYQAAVTYARERIQSAALTGKTKEPVAIIQHPDVRRNLMLMKSQIMAMRGLIYHALACFDRARAGTSEQERAAAQAEVDLLTPIVKSWCTDKGVELASIGVQIHGGMGFIEETGAAQYYRDARILPIYEGTNGVQALDLMGRKTLRDGGKATDQLIAQMRITANELAEQDEVSARRLSDGIDALDAGKAWLLSTGDIETNAAGATAYQELFSIVAGGWIMARRMLAATTEHERNEQLPAALFYLSTLMPQATSLAESLAGNAVVNKIDASYF